MTKVRGLVLVGSLIVCLNTFANGGGEGSKGGGGGDARTEGRIDEIREDILKWIDAGGARAFQFPNGITYEDYVNGNPSKRITGMRELLAPKAVVVTAILTSQEKKRKPELNTLVGGQPKTCKGFFGRKDGRPHILCNVERFALLSETEQYRQVHHEYAGLGLIERNEGAASDYALSSQITRSLEPASILKLVVRVPQAIVQPASEYVACNTLPVPERKKLNLPRGTWSKAVVVRDIDLGSVEAIGQDLITKRVFVRLRAGDRISMRVSDGKWDIVLEDGTQVNDVEAQYKIARGSQLFGLDFEWIAQFLCRDSRRIIRGDALPFSGTREAVRADIQSTSVGFLVSRLFTTRDVIEISTAINWTGQGFVITGEYVSKDTLVKLRRVGTDENGEERVDVILTTKQALSNEAREKLSRRYYSPYFNVPLK